MGFAKGTRHLIIATFTASFTTRHEAIAWAKIASVCFHGNGSIVAQNQPRSRADTTENTAK